MLLRYSTISITRRSRLLWHTGHHHNTHPDDIPLALDTYARLMRVQQRLRGGGWKVRNEMPEQSKHTHTQTHRALAPI